MRVRDHVCKAPFKAMQWSGRASSLFCGRATVVARVKGPLFSTVHFKRNHDLIYKFSDLALNVSGRFS